MKPFLSILIPTFNRAQMTLEAIASVGNNPGVEIVVVDDCSDEKVWDSYLDWPTWDQDYPMVKLYRNKTNLGMTKNFNECMKVAEGDWFSLIGSDDYYKPGAIDRVVQALHHLPPCLIVYARDGKAKVLPPGVETVRNMQLPSGSGNFWHRSIYEDLGGFDERLTFSPDAEYWYRIATKYPVAESPEKFSIYREHGNNLMYDTWRKRDEFLKQIKLITRLNMVHRGEDTTDLDLVVASEGKAVWETVLYILRVTSTKPDKFDIFDMYLDAGLRLAFTKDRLDAIKLLMNARNKK
jgi:glycosyltransferase involved in cell wall biosynthesis